MHYYIVFSRCIFSFPWLRSWRLFSNFFSRKSDARDQLAACCGSDLQLQALGNLPRELQRFPANKRRPNHRICVWSIRTYRQWLVKYSCEGANGIWNCAGKCNCSSLDWYNRAGGTMEAVRLRAKWGSKNRPREMRSFKLLPRRRKVVIRTHYDGRRSEISP